MGSLMQKGMGMWKEMLDSPDMQAMMSNPEQMREMMLPFVEMMGGDTAKLDEVLADPEKLKASMNEGLEVSLQVLLHCETDAMQHVYIFEVCNTCISLK